jgi:cellobiose dehydrogenase (acceptor)
MTLDSRLGTVVSTAPYLHDDQDKAAVIKGIENVQETFKNIQNLTWISPKPGVSATDFVNSVSQLLLGSQPFSQVSLTL